MKTKDKEYWLTLDLSTSIGGICLHQVRPLRLLSERKLNDRFKHSEQLISSLDEVLNESNITLSEVDLFITTLGPGSFTGLRIALATLKALSYAKGIPIAVVPSHECRFMSWEKSNPSQSGQTVNVLTLLSATSGHLAKYQGSKLKEEKFGNVDLLKLEDCDVLISDEISFEIENLAECFTHSQQKKIARTWSEIQALTPEYWGSRYRTISDGEISTPTLPK